ncbi:MAG: hypothetical protein ACOYI5_07940 [Christensenellales bacterium]|jgi:hypothetical protein
MDCQVNYRNCAQPDNNGAGLERRGLFCICSVRVICFLAALLSLALGLILGAVFSAVILPALPAVIVFTVTMAVLIIAILIIRYCYCCRLNRCN